MLQIRNSIFETNSSSVHSLTFISDEEYELFKSGQALFDRYNGAIVSLSAAAEEDDDDDGWSLRRYFSKDNLYKIAECYGGEAFYTTQTLPDGHRVNYICYYGRD